MPLVKADELKLKMTFRVSLYRDKSIYRDIYLVGFTDLEDFAGQILKSFKFDFDHCCGFYSNLKDMYSSDEIYELFVDLDSDGEHTEGAKSLRDNLIRDVFEPKKKMLFYFDYGDGWAFEVVCTKKEMTDIGKDDSKIIKSEGKAPKQYPRTKKGLEEAWRLKY